VKPVFSSRFYQGALLLLMVVAFSAYYPGANGPYLLDDMQVLQNNPAFSSAVLGQYGIAPAAHSFLQGFNRPLSMLSFALDYQLAGNINAYSIKLTNIFLHLLTGLLLYRLSRRLYPLLMVNWQGRVPGENEVHGVALLATALWLLHPLHVSTVLYAVQRMTMLSSLFIVMGLLHYLEGRQQLIDGSKSGLLWLFSAFGLAGVAAVMSKENGALLVFYALLLEMTIFRFQISDRFSSIVRGIVVALPLIPSVIVSGLILRYLFLPESFSTRDFTAMERLLTESRVLLFYLSELFYPAVDRMGLFWGGELPSRGLLQPISTLFSVTAIASLLLFALWGAWKNRWIPLAFAILWFLCGHAMESTVVPLELVFEHRNYLPSYGLALWLAWLLLAPDSGSRSFKRLRYGLVLLLPLVLLGTLAQRVEYWSSADSFYQHELQRTPRSARLWESYALHLERSGREALAIGIYRQAAVEYEEDATFTLGQWVLLRSDAESVPHSLTRQVIRQLQTHRVTRGHLYNLLRLVYSCDTVENEDLEQALISAIQNEHWFAPNWRELGIVVLSDYYRRHSDVEKIQLWLERLPKGPLLDVIRKQVDELEEQLKEKGCAPDRG
jgi:hypothetical protein